MLTSLVSRRKHKRKEQLKKKPIHNKNPNEALGKLGGFSCKCSDVHNKDTCAVFCHFFALAPVGFLTGEWRDKCPKGGSNGEGDDVVVGGKARWEGRCEQT